jgi:hypothetical protein
MTRKQKKLTPEQKAFINGKTESVSLPVDVTKIPKGPGYVLQRPGSGVHGKSGRAKNRAERKAAKQSLREQD